MAEMAPECEALLIGPRHRLPRGGVGGRRPVLMSVRRSSAVVLDALALAAVAEDLSRLGHLDRRAVLTPNLSELAHTLGWETGRSRPPAGGGPAPDGTHGGLASPRAVRRPGPPTRTAGTGRDPSAVLVRAPPARATSGLSWHGSSPSVYLRPSELGI